MKKENSSKKASGFKVPKDYFRDFSPSLFEKIQQEKPWPKDDGYRIPQHYFDDFEDRLFQKLPRKKTTPIISLSAHRTIYYTISTIAAAFVLFIGIKNFLPIANTAQYSISDADVEAYIDSGYMALNSDDIAAVFEDVTLDMTTITDDAIEDEQLVNYLHENLEDYNDMTITE